MKPPSEGRGVLPPEDLRRCEVAKTTKDTREGSFDRIPGSLTKCPNIAGNHVLTALCDAMSHSRECVMRVCHDSFEIVSHMTRDISHTKSAQRVCHDSFEMPDMTRQTRHLQGLLCVMS